MIATDPKSLPTIGFLTVIEHAEHGLFGGYLILTSNGRPLEFHCTAPVRPNRAQEILYGPTLKPYLYGEQIGRTLLNKAQAPPLFVCTDVEPALAVRPLVGMPVALLLDAPCSSQEQAAADCSVESRYRGESRRSGTRSLLTEFDLGAHQLATLGRYGNDRQHVISRWQPYVDEFDLREPFQRIRDAIEEAHKTAQS